MQPPETIQKLAFDGPLSIAQLTGVGVLAAIVIGWLMWRDCRRSASPKAFALLFFTRFVALLVVLWMLAGASVVTVLRETKPKSVVVLVDSSASMGTVDPVDGSGNTVGWSTGRFPALERLDRAAGELRSAGSGVARIRSLLRSEDPGDQPQVAWARVIDSIDAAAAELGRFNPGSGDADPAIVGEIARVTAFLKEGAAPMRNERWSASGARLRTGDQSAGDRLDDADAFIEAGARQIERAAQKLAIHLEQAAGPDSAALSAQSRLARRDKVMNWLDAGEESWIQELEENVRVLRYSFASEVLPVPGDDWRQALFPESDRGAGSTDLTAALDRVVQDAAGESVDAVVLVTDGGHNVPGDPRETATSLRGIPLYVLPIGDTKMPRDVILHHAHAPRAVFRNDNIVIDAMVTAYGCEGENLQFELWAADVMVDKKTLTAASMIYDGRISFQRKATELGRQKMWLRLVPLAGEHSDSNNEAQLEVDVMEDMIRVLIADDRPRWEFRYLVNLFKRDKHVEFEQLLFEPNDDPRSPGSRPTFPRDIESWRKYRVIILGDVTPAYLNRAQQDMLRKYVTEEGGNLIVIAGETGMPAGFANQPLAAMIPVTTGPPDNQAVALAVTPEGNASVATQLDDDSLLSERIWREMSTKVPIYLPATTKAKPTGHVLINAGSARAGTEPQAFLSWQYVGLGRVVYIAAPVTYQLRYRNGDRHHHRFWGQLLRWAIAREMGGGSRTVRLATDKTAYENGEPVQATVHLIQPDGSPVTGARGSIEAAQGAESIRTVELQEDPAAPGTYRATLADLPVGQIALRVAGAAIDSLLAAEGYRAPVEQLVNVEPRASSELNNPICNLPLLRQLADASGGAIVRPAAVPGALSQRNAVPETRETVLARQPVWNRWHWLWLFAGCVTFEWLARKYWRMV